MRFTTLDLFVLFASLITLIVFLSLAVIRGPEPKYFALIASSGLVALVKLVKAFRPRLIPPRSPIAFSRRRLECGDDGGRFKTNAVDRPGAMHMQPRCRYRRR